MPALPPARDPFVLRHGLLDAGQLHRCEEIAERLDASGIRFVRLAWADPHGFSRAKLITSDAFRSAVRNGHNINIATSTLDSAGARVFASFTPGGGLGIEEMTGSPNLIVVPDPATFRILPWDGGVGWILCDEYFTNGKPFPFSPRQLLKKQIAALEQRGWGMSVGLEVEWYLLKLATEALSDANVGGPGLRGAPIATAVVEPGYQLHSESGLDMMQPMLIHLAEAYEALGLPLRSIENEWGPGQVECTFAPQEALTAADTMFLFRTATRQVCRRHGFLASFMTRPALPRFVASGWHLHHSLLETTDGRNLLMPHEGPHPLSQMGLAWLGGLLAHAVPGTAFSTPTVNGYRRFRGFSLAPDRTTWAVDHRGVMVRVLSGAGDPATRFENRVGEPAANPYLFIAQQIASGLAGVDAGANPGPQDLEPYAADRPLLPKSLMAALDALEQSAEYRKAFGDLFIDYFVKLKRTEAGRFHTFLAERGMQPGDDPTEWEQNEYFDFF